jgi:hypothetical protein
MNNLKSLAEIAFDAFQCFAAPEKKYAKKFTELNDREHIVFERIAGRVEAEIALRREDVISMPHSHAGK